jgi:ribosome-associated protein
LTLAKTFAVAAAKLAAERNCSDVVVLELKGKSAVTDYFVIVTGTSERQMKSVSDDISERGRKYDMKRFGRAGYERTRWILLDFVDVIVHIFDGETREYYDLELLWGDAKRIEWDKSRK